MPKVQVIDETGKNLGILETKKAIRLAQERGLDLVEIAPNVRPPVCKFLDYGKYKYELMKKEQKRKAKAKRVEVKGVRISPRISKNDLEFKAKQADKFIKEGHKVRIEMILKGREYAHTELIQKIFNQFLETMAEKVKIEQKPKKQRLGMAMVVTKV